MATSDDMQAFLKVMANLHALSGANAAQRITSELLTLRERDQDSSTTINRLTEANARFIQQSEAAEVERQTLNNRVNELQESMTHLRKDCAEINRIADERGRRLREKSAKLTQLEEHRVNLVRGSKDEVGMRWSQLWTYVNQLATTFFSEDLEEETLREAHDFEPNTSHQYQKTFPSPSTNTTEAKQMRIIAVNSRIATALTRHIFRPVGMDNSFAVAVSNLARANPDMESFYRSSHLAVLESLPDYRLSIVTRTVKAAVAEIVSSVSCIVKAENKEEFRARLEDVCKRASEEWQAFQRYSERYEADMDGDKVCYEHVPLWQPAKAQTPKTNGTAKTPSLGPVQNVQKAAEQAEVKTPSAAIVTSVWPLLKVVGTAGADPGISGLALFSDQTRRVEEQVRRENRKASREESKQDDWKSSKRPVSLGAFLQGSP